MYHKYFRPGLQKLEQLTTILSQDYVEGRDLWDGELVEQYDELGFDLYCHLIQGAYAQYARTELAASHTYYASDMLELWLCPHDTTWGDYYGNIVTRARFVMLVDWLEDHATANEWHEAHGDYYSHSLYLSPRFFSLASVAEDKQAKDDRLHNISELLEMVVNECSAQNYWEELELELEQEWWANLTRQDLWLELRDSADQVVWENEDEDPEALFYTWLDEIELKQQKLGLLMGEAGIVGDIDYQHFICTSYELTGRNFPFCYAETANAIVWDCISRTPLFTDWDEFVDACAGYLASLDRAFQIKNGQLMLAL